MANILTSLRIVCGLLILFFPAFSVPFYALYIFGGITDALDGAVARKLGTETPLGAKLDTAADIVFALAVGGKLVCAVAFPAWLLIWIGGILALKIANIVIGFVRCKTFVAVHSVPNKICGVVVYLVPLLLGADLAEPVKAAGAGFVCLLATGAAIDESVKTARGSE